MDGYSSKRGVSMSRAPRNGCNTGSTRDAKSAQDQNVQFCNRIGCNGRIKYENRNIKTRSSEKAKSSDSSSCPLNRNGVIETSSRNGPVIAREKSPYLDSKRKLSSQLRFDQSESSKVPLMKTGSGPSNLASRRKIQYTSGSNKLNPQTTSAVSSTSKSSGLGALNSNNRSKCPKNLKCNSMSNASPPSCSLSISKSPSKNVIKKRSLETNATFSEGVFSSSGGASTSDYRRSSCTSGEDSRVRLSYRQNRRTTSCYRDSELPRNVGRSRLLQHHSANPSTSSSSSYSLFSSNDDSQSTLRPYSSAEHEYSQLVDFDTLQQYNMDGIAEVLLALERIEQEEEMTNEQILALGSSLYLSGLMLYDQHRDMRLDIDDMSYEDLLALTDRIGSVSTALSEEELLKCVNRSIYQVTPPEVGFRESGEDGDDVKCSICQEDYINGDGMGKLVECEHAYHVGCIYHWLRLKNWCPICKTCATPSSSSYC